MSRVYTCVRARAPAPATDSVSPGLLGRIGRPSVARAAWSRGWLPDRLRPRCSCERRPPSEPEQPYRNALPVECPVAPLCGTLRVAGWSCRHNGVPGTSRWGVFPACPGSAPGPGDLGAVRRCDGADPQARIGVSEASATAIRPTNCYSTHAYPTLAKTVQSVFVNP